MDAANIYVKIYSKSIKNLKKKIFFQRFLVFLTQENLFKLYVGFLYVFCMFYFLFPFKIQHFMSISA